MTTDKLVRSNGQTSASGAIGVLGAGVIVAIGANAKHGGTVTYVLATGLLALGLRQFFFAGVRVAHDGIIIRGSLYTRRVAWSELEGFSFGACGVFPNVGIAILHSGRRFAITAIGTGPVSLPTLRRNAEALIATLNERLAEQREAAGAVGQQPHPVLK